MRIFRYRETLELVGEVVMERMEDSGRNTMERGEGAVRICMPSRKAGWLAEVQWPRVAPAVLFHRFSEEESGIEIQDEKWKRISPSTSFSRLDSLPRSSLRSSVDARFPAYLLPRHLSIAYCLTYFSLLTSVYTLPETEFPPPRRTTTFFHPLPVSQTTTICVSFGPCSVISFTRRCWLIAAVGKNKRK